MLEFITDDKRWDAIVAASHFSDFFHLKSYHNVFANYENCAAEMACFENGEYFIAVPLLIRPIRQSSSSEPLNSALYDATSVYGYAGPLASHPFSIIPPSVIRRFQAELTQALSERRIVSLFCRLHPLASAEQSIGGLGSGSTTIGQTVSIDLRQPLAEQIRKYRKSHRSDINKLRALGATCHVDNTLYYLDDFMRVYNATMARSDASQWYRFSKPFFDELLLALRGKLHISVCKLHGKVISASIVSKYKGICHSSLGGADDNYRHLSPEKIEIDALRIWGWEEGAHTVFLGGGLGSRMDSLFHFKAGFSDQFHPFSVWRWVIMPDQYNLLCGDMRKRDSSGGTDWFPAYRE